MVNSILDCDLCCYVQEIYSICYSHEYSVVVEVDTIHNIFFFKQKTAYEMLRSLVGSEMCIRDRPRRWLTLHNSWPLVTVSSGKVSEVQFFGQFRKFSTLEAG
eukprot:TRINITY_DN22769_c0_g1_i2.p1 TRINITY_DN22769_c0_g1~~TRINITY_DN22769_c0_g1_i2.p1  ORF type:complete len:103 (+),score=14.32 TRINITY_DN22769_c0_g1_i2:4-312(+)